MALAVAWVTLVWDDANVPNVTSIVESMDLA